MESIFRMFARLGPRGKRQLAAKIKAECDTFPQTLVKIPVQLTHGGNAPMEAWRSRGYLVQVYDVNDEWERISINRTAFDSHYTRWLDGISWEKIQELKAECGRGHCEAVEIYPSDKDIVNVANLRHIWVRKTGSIMADQGIGWLKKESVC